MIHYGVTCRAKNRRRRTTKHLSRVKKSLPRFTKTLRKIPPKDRSLSWECVRDYFRPPATVSVERANVRPGFGRYFEFITILIQRYNGRLDFLRARFVGLRPRSLAVALAYSGSKKRSCNLYATANESVVNGRAP